jgi:ABC-type protease/lipase transport system fused ATPase/permease subunit
VVVSALAAIAGALLVVSHRSVLTAGVMIALALVPAAALIPVALIGGDATRAGWAALRWSTEAALVLGGRVGGCWRGKRHRDGRQRMLL